MSSTQRRLTEVLFCVLSLILLKTAAYGTSADGFDFPIGIPDHTGWIKSQKFNDYFEGKGYHLGEDWIKKYGSSYAQPVYAVADGVVIRAGQFGSCWKGVVMILHSAPPDSAFNLPLSDKTPYVTSFYAHLQNLTVGLDDNVTRGDKIGEIAPTTSCSTGPHLHFELRRDVYNNLGPIPLGNGYINRPVTADDSWVNPTNFITLNRHLITTDKYDDCSIPPETTTCCCFVQNHIHDLQTSFPIGSKLHITYRAGTPGGHCSQSLAYFYVSTDKVSWALLGTDVVPERSGQADTIHTKDFLTTVPFRYAKVYIPTCYNDWSSAEATFDNYQK